MCVYRPAVIGIFINRYPGSAAPQTREYTRGPLPPGLPVGSLQLHSLLCTFGAGRPLGQARRPSSPSLARPLARSPLARDWFFFRVRGFLFSVQEHAKQKLSFKHLSVCFRVGGFFFYVCLEAFHAGPNPWDRRVWPRRITFFNKI